MNAISCGDAEAESAFEIDLGLAKQIVARSEWLDGKKSLVNRFPEFWGRFYHWARTCGRVDEAEEILGQAMGRSAFALYQGATQCPQHLYLCVLPDGWVSVQQAQKHFGLLPNSTLSVLRELEAAGLVESRKDRKSRRVQFRAIRRA